MKQMLVWQASSKQKLKKALYQMLENRRGWRLFKVVYWSAVGVVSFFTVTNFLANDADTETTAGKIGVSVFIVIFLLAFFMPLYLLLRRFAVYIVFGPLAQIQSKAQKKTGDSALDAITGHQSTPNSNGQRNWGSTVLGVLLTLMIIGGIRAATDNYSFSDNSVATTNSKRNAFISACEQEAEKNISSAAASQYCACAATTLENVYGKEHFYSDTNLERINQSGLSKADTDALVGNCTYGDQPGSTT